MSPRTARGLLALYALSGAAGLAWQVVWVRAFTPVFGAGLEAIAAVTACFLGGLGVGGALAGRLLDRVPALRLYAGVEAGVGLWGMALPWMLGAVGPLYLALSVAAGEGAALTALRLGVAAALVGPPAVALGVSFPAVALALGAEQAPRRVGLAYGANALGAAGGALLAGLWLPWALGLRGGSALLGAVDLVVAAGAWRLAGGAAAGPAAPASPGAGGRVPRGYWAVAALSGAVGMGLEVSWSRLSGPLIAAKTGSDATAFAAILAAVLAGIGLGGLWAATPRPGALGRWGRVQGVLALGVLLTLEPVRELALGARRVELVEALLPALPALALGAGFPLLSAAWLERGAALGAALPRLYAVNTLGAVLGSLLAGFWLVPALGAQRLAAGLAVVAAGLGAAVTPGAWRVLAVAVGLGAAAHAALAPPIAGLRVLPPGEQIVEALEGRDATTLVSSRPPDPRRTLTSAGHRIDAEAQGAVSDHVQRARGPALLHPRPRRVLLVGLGTGETARTFLKLPSVEQLTVVELDGNQRRLLRHFGTQSLLVDPRAELIAADGRALLRRDGRLWDVIAVDAYGPRTSSAAFYTREFWEEARARLAPGGLVFVKFNPALFTEPQSLASYLGTLFDVFPGGALVWVQRGLLGLVGAEQLTDLQADPDALVADAQTAAPLVAGVPRHTDDHPVRVIDEMRPAFELLLPYWQARGVAGPPPWAQRGPQPPRR